MHMASLHTPLLLPLHEAVILGLGILVLSILILSKCGRNSSRLKYPPGPRPWPLVGNLGQLGILPHRTLADLAKRYGPIMFLRLGSVPTVVVSSPAMAKEILKTHDAVFADRAISSTGKYLCYGHRGVAYAFYGDYWRHMRKLCTVELFTAKRVDSFKWVRESEVSAMIRSIWEESRQGSHAVDLSKSVGSMTRNISCRMLASRTYSDDDFGGGLGFKEMIEEIFSLAGAFCIGDFIPYLDWLDLQGIRRRMKFFSKIFDDFIEKVIDEHIQRRTTSNPESQGLAKDMVDVLLDMAEAETNITEFSLTRVSIKAILLDMLVGGLESTTTTIEWAMSELLRNPQTLARAQEELESVVGRKRSVEESDLGGCEYLQCVVKETLRLHPPGVLLVPRESREDCRVGDYFIPRKTRVLTNIWAIGRDESVWEKANDFDPERFMGKDIDIRGRDFEVIPFGAGRRGCPAISTGLAVVELGVAQLLHCYDWSVDGEVGMEEMFGLTVPRKFHLFARPAQRLIMDN